MRTTGASLYDKDFYAWTQEQAALVRSGKVHELDLDNVAEELESLGKSEWRALGSRLDVLVRHLLKWRYQSVRRSPSWQSTIWTQRRAIQRLLRLSPSLRQQVPTMILEDYASIRKQAATETHLPLASFPDACPWTSEQVLDEDFWPEEQAETDRPPQVPGGPEGRQRRISHLDESDEKP